MKLLSLFLLLILLPINNFAMNVDAQGYKIQKEPSAPPLSSVCASATASHSELQSLSNITTQRVDKKRIVPLYSDRLLNLVPALAQFPKEVWQNIIMPYAMDRTMQESISFDLSKFHTDREKGDNNIPGVPNHARTKYIDYHQNHMCAIFDTATSQILYEIPYEYLYRNSVIWSPNDSFLGIYLRNDAVHIVDILSGQTTPLPDARAFNTREIAWRHDSNQIATLTTKDDIAIWEITNLEKPLVKLDNPKKHGSHAALLWTAHNQLIIAYSKIEYSNGPIEIWDPANKKLIRSLEDSADYHFARYALSPSSKYLATFSWGEEDSDGTLNLWNIETGKLEHRLPHTMSDLNAQFAWSPDETYLMIQHWFDPILLVDMRTGNKRSILQEDGKNIIMWGAWNTPTPSWNQGKKITIYSSTAADTYDFNELHTFDDGLLTKEQSILLWILNNYKNKGDGKLTLQSIAQDLEQEHITKKDLYDVLISFSPKIRLAIIAHYKITDAIGASPSSTVLAGDKSSEQKPDAK